MKIIVTGGSGFIGSALVLHLLEKTDHEVLNLDALTYAANPASLAGVAGHPRYAFRRVDIRDLDAVRDAFAAFQPDAVMNLAAESHVDRSITASREFIETNVLGTHTLLEASRERHAAHPGFRFHHISTDEVFGDLGADDPAFTETTPYTPRSPYSSSKAASDHLVRAWGNTYGLPVLITNCSNNYGPRQFPEKLIPHMILNALSGRPLPVYGDGGQIRDWLHVEDHVGALTLVLEKGRLGETYNIGGNHEMKNLELVHQLCDLLDDMVPERRPEGLDSYRGLITFVTDRPGHDRRYSVDTSKIAAELGWRPAHTFTTGLRETLRWYLDNESWWQPILSGDYRLERLGLGS